MAWNNQSSKCTGAVFFRGSIVPQAHEFDGLEKLQITATPTSGGDKEAWALRLSHPQWGNARLSASAKPTSIPKAILKFDARLSDAEKLDAALGKSSVRVEVDGEKGDVLRDRKRLLRFMNAVMGTDALIALDFNAMRFWPRPALADELCHDADLDIDSLFTIHAIYRGEDQPAEQAGDKTVGWFHTHGLAEIGFFDFDIVRPSPDLLTSRCHDFARALAFSIVEEKVKVSTPTAKISSAGPIALVDVAEFNRRASAGDRAVRDTDELHNRNRTVLCEPVKDAWYRKFRPAPVIPSKLLSAPQGEFMVYFPSHATRLMEKRARQTYEMFRAMSEEFADLQARPIVKLGYRIDGGGPEDLEHMWFEVHELHTDRIDATLVNQPHQISGMKAGDRKMHALSRLTDWMLIGPTGAINPRDTRPARTAREHRGKLLDVVSNRGI